MGGAIREIKAWTGVEKYIKTNNDTFLLLYYLLPFPLTVTRTTAEFQLLVFYGLILTRSTSDHREVERVELEPLDQLLSLSIDLHFEWSVAIILTLLIQQWVNSTMSLYRMDAPVIAILYGFSSHDVLLQVTMRCINSSRIKYGVSSPRPALWGCWRTLSTDSLQSGIVFISSSD